MSSPYNEGHEPHSPPTPPPILRPTKRRRKNLDAQDMDGFHAMSLTGILNVSGCQRSFTDSTVSQQQAPILGIAFSPEYATRLPVPINHASQFPTLSIGGSTLDAACLSIPLNISHDERMRRQASLTQELAHQAQNPPLLPPTQVQDLPPKPYVKEFLKIPENISDRHRKRIEAANNAIAAEHQRVERERNNQAAKKSRQTRMESLANTRRMLNEKTAECTWFRLKLVILGGSVDEWDRVPIAVKDKMVKDVDERVRAIETQNADVKKKEDSRKRAERIKRRAEMEEYEGRDEIEDFEQIGEDDPTVAGKLTVSIRVDSEERFILDPSTTDVER